MLRERSNSGSEQSEYKNVYLYPYVFAIALGGFNVGIFDISDCFLKGYNLTVFNTLIGVLQKTFNWTDDERSI